MIIHSLDNVTTSPFVTFKLAFATSKLAFVIFKLAFATSKPAFATFKLAFLNEFQQIYPHLSSWLMPSNALKIL